MRLALLVGAAVVALALGAQAASVAVIDEGQATFSYRLVLDPGELAPWFMIDLEIPEGTTFDWPAPHDVSASLEPNLFGFSITLEDGVTAYYSGAAWTNLPRIGILGPDASRVLRVAGVFDPFGAGAWTDTGAFLADGTEQTYEEWINSSIRAGEVFGPPPVDPRSIGVGVPVARLTNVVGEPPSRVVMAACGSRCDVPVDAPEPAAAVLLGLGLAGLGLIRRRWGPEPLRRHAPCIQATATVGGTLMRITTLLAASALLIGATARAQENTAWVEGHVFNKWTGVPLQFAVVTILDRSRVIVIPGLPEPRVLGSAVTDASGFYSIELDVDDLITPRIQLECGDLVPEIPQTRVGFFQAPITPRPGTLRRDLYLDGPRKRGFDTCKIPFPAPGKHRAD